MKYVLTDAAVRKLRASLASHAGNTGARGAPASVSPDDYPAPYTVRWAQSENSGQGAWVIWFPIEQTAKNIQNPVLMVGTVRIAASGVTDASTLPLGWKILPNAAAGGEVWLRVDVPRGAGLDDPDWASNISAIFKTQDDTPPYNPTDQYTHYAIPIAKAWTDQNSGAKLARQYVTSLVKLSVNADKGGDGGGGDEESAHPLPYEVRWDANLGSGAWKIYLPTNDLLFYDGQYIATSAMTGISLISDGWYSLSAVSSSSAKVYLVITDTPGQSSSTVTAAFTDTPGQASTSSEVINIRIADVSYNSQDDSTAVGQSVVGALHLGGNVIYLDDVTWDTSSHQLKKQWIRHNTVTGNDTILTTTPSGKTATISTTPISSIIGS